MSAGKSLTELSQCLYETKLNELHNIKPVFYFIHVQLLYNDCRCTSFRDNPITIPLLCPNPTACGLRVL